MSGVLFLVCHSISITAPVVYILRTRHIQPKKDFDHFLKVLSGKKGWKAFKRQLVLELCVENCLFIERVAFLALLSTDTVNAEFFREGNIAKEWMAIYDSFIKSGGEYELNIAYERRSNLEVLMQSFTLNVADYYPIVMEILHILYKSCFHRFLESDNITNSNDDAGDANAISILIDRIRKIEAI